MRTIQGAFNYLIKKIPLEHISAPPLNVAFINIVLNALSFVV